MKSSEEAATAALVIIGNEILSGRTVDANLPYLARELNALGIPLLEARIVPDVEERIVEAVNACRRRHTYLFTTGGIGPTHDDITAASIAKAFGRRLVRHPEAERRLRAYYPPEKINAARLKMADMPEGAELIDNPISTAPGFRVENVFVLAGIPRVMQAMFEGIRHRLEGGPPILSRTVTLLAPEGDVARLLADIQDAFPTVEIGSYPFLTFARPGTSVVFRSRDAAACEAASARLEETARARGIAIGGEEEPEGTGEKR